MRSGNIVDFKAERGSDIVWVEGGNLPHIKADRVPGIVKVMNLVSDLPNARPHSSIRPLNACASNSDAERMLLGDLEESLSGCEHCSRHAAFS